MNKINRRSFLQVMGASAAVLGLTACGSASSAVSTAASSTAAGSASAAPAAAGDITLWTYPIGKFGDADTMNTMLAAFNAKYPDIHVTVEYLDYTNGDDQVTSAIEAGTTPDVIMEGPERLVSNWGAKGKMLDISDLWTEEATADISGTSANIVSACKWTDGAYYEYPLCMTTHCMAINKEAFEKADALQYIKDDGTWTTDDFQKALAAVKAKGGVQETCAIYCGGQGGDQGTRALVTNLYNAKFTNADHTAYTIDSEEGKKALQFLVDEVKAGDMSADAGIVAADELKLFANGTVAMSFCWNASNYNANKDAITFTPMPVAFPSDDGFPELCGGIWGFGLFNNGDDGKAAAAKMFIQFVCDDAKQGPESVRQSTFFPVRASYGDVYAGTDSEEMMSQFKGFMQYLGDYYNVTPGWAEQRTAWWNMLQAIFAGTSVEDALATYDAACETALKA